MSEVAYSRLAALRESKGFTQQQLACHSGIPVETIRLWEKSNHELYAAKTTSLFELAQALDISLSELFC